MTVEITLSCDGCFVETGPHRLPRREFQSFSGKGYGFGVWTKPGLDDVKFPDGWLYSDPVSGCTYCPNCWASIVAESEAS